MDREQAIERLPTSYAVALRAIDQGMTLDEVGSLLGVEPATVPALITVAREKLQALMKAPA